MFCYAAYLSVPTCAWIRSTDLTFNEVFLDSCKLRKEELSLQLILNLDWHTVDRLESEALAFTPLENPTWDSMPDIQKTITQTSTYTCTFLDRRTSPQPFNHSYSKRLMIASSLPSLEN